MSFHFRKFIELRQSILQNNFLPSFSFNEFHGSLAMIFYPYFNLYIMVLLSLIIKSSITIIYLFFAVNTFLSLIISFYSCNSYVHSKFTSYLFALMYGLSNVILGYYFAIMDLGLASAYIFIPLSVFGFINIIKGKNNWIELSLGMSLIFFNHILSFIVILLFLFVWLMINFNKFNKLLFIRLFKSSFIFIIITSIVWLPLINIYVHNFNNIFMPPPSIHLKRISIKVFSSGLYGAKTPDTLGTFALIAIFISIIFYKKFDKIVKQMYIFSLIIILSILFFPWKIISLKIINQFQFTYRFLIIPQILLTFIFSMIITKYIKSLRKKQIFYISTIILSLFLQFMAQYTFINTALHDPSVNSYLNINEKYRGDKYRIDHSYQINKILNANPDFETIDYIPKSSHKISYFVNRNVGIYDDKHFVLVNNNNYNSFNFPNKNNMNKLSLPVYMYNKEKVKIYLNNRPIKYYINKNGLLTINNIQNYVKYNNNIYIKIIPDKFKITGIILSLFGCLFLIFIIVKKNKLK